MPLHDMNPVTRSANNLVAFLGATEELNELELNGIVVACQTSVLVTEAMYKQVMMALMRYCEKYRTVEKFSALMAVILPVFAQILIKSFDDRRKLPAANWIRQKISRLKLFIESAPMLECASALQNKTQPSNEDLRQVSGTTTGNHLFKCFRESLMVTDFMKSVSARLDG